MKFVPPKKESRRPLLLVLAVSLALNLSAIWWGLPGLRGWAPDELVPSTIMDAVGMHFSHGWVSPYPPFHYYVLAVAHLPFRALARLHLLDFNSASIYTALFYLGRLISVLMATLIVVLVYRIGREIYDRRAATLAALITALIAPFVYHAKIATVDIPYIFWFTLSLLFFVRILKNHSLADYLLFGAAAALAVCAKDQAYGFYVLTAPAILFALHRHRKKKDPSAKFARTLVDRRIFLPSLLAALLFVLLHNILFDPQSFLAHLRLVIGPASDYIPVYENTIQGHLNMLWQSTRHIHFSLGWPLFSACIAGLGVSTFSKKRNPLLFWLLIPGLSYYLFFIHVVRMNFDRWLIPLCIILSFFGGKLLSDLVRPDQKLAASKKALVGALLIYSFFYSASVDLLMAKDSRYQVEKWMRDNIGTEALVGVLDSKEYLPRLDGFRWTMIKFPLRDFEQEKPDYLLINVEYMRRHDPKGPKYKFHLDLTQKKLKYRLAASYKFNSKWILMSPGSILTNLEKINPEIRIYKRLT
jgi:4-amino-4-deoxy-L-arabinose transferase-like glycosyltransferase